MSRNEDKPVQSLSYCSSNQSPVAARVGHRITFSTDFISFSGGHSFLAKFTSVIPGREAACFHLQWSRIAMKGSISLKKQYSVEIPWYLCIACPLPRMQFCGKKNALILFTLNVWCSVKEKLLKAVGCDLTGWQPPSPRHYLLNKPHTHGKNGVCILDFAETRPPASNYFTPLNAPTAKPLSKTYSLFLSV